MHICETLTNPPNPHPLRPIEGFKCKRSEISGRRLWSWTKEYFRTSEESFFKDFIVIKYCPLAFVESSGRNRTPNKLPRKEKKPLFEACYFALKSTINILDPKIVIGIGAFAETRIKVALKKLEVSVGRITHLSPANPKANKGWPTIIEYKLTSMELNLNYNN